MSKIVINLSFFLGGYDDKIFFMSESMRPPETAFDRLPVAQRSAIGTHVTTIVKAKVEAKEIKPREFISAFVAECNRIAQNPHEVAAVVAAQEKAGMAR